MLSATEFCDVSFSIRLTRLAPLVAGDSHTKPQADASDFDNAHDKNT